MGRRLRAGLRAAWVAAMACLVAACATPVGTRLVDGRAVHQSLTASALSSTDASVYTRRTLQREGLGDAFADDATAAIAQLHARYVEQYRAGSPVQEVTLFALAETAFLHAEASGTRAYFLASAAYAYAFLFPDAQGGGPRRLFEHTPFDPRVRIAADLYNRALAEGLLAPAGAPDADPRPREVLLDPGRHALPSAELEIVADPAGFTWAGYRLGHFVPSANLEVRGLRNRYRLPGLGVPLAASLIAPDDEQSARQVTEARIPPRLKIPVSALLRLEDPRRGVAEGRLRGTMSVHTSDTAPDVRIGDRLVPIEYEPSAALAFTLEGSPVWEFELAGFLSGGFTLPQRIAHPREPALRAPRPEDGLVLMAPYRAGRIPVVLVHGTASSPARWAELFNELQVDPRIAARYQIWLFMYNTGNPVIYSAALLREALLNTVRELDPDGKDPALRQMVVIGHSQGGLLTKLMAVRSGTRFWDNFSAVPFEEIDLRAETRDLLRRTLFFEPLPHVRRVVFVATPHRGTPLAAMGLVGWLTRFIKLPATMVGVAGDILALGRERLLVRSIDRIPSAVENMSPSHPFIKTLAALPIADGVTAHSIVAVKGAGPPAEGSDGVVPYWSAHIEPVASELVVRSSHSVQGNSHAIEEIRRILLEHAGER